MRKTLPGDGSSANRLVESFTNLGSTFCSSSLAFFVLIAGEDGQLPRDVVMLARLAFFSS
jgi:hypothetical protein